MFIVECDAGYNLFYLASFGWTIDMHRATRFVTRAGARKALNAAYKTRRDTTRIIIA